MADDMGDTFNFNGSIGQFVKEGDGIIEHYHAQSVAASSSVQGGEASAASAAPSAESKEARNTELQVGGMASEEGLGGNVRIANKKKTSVLVVLNAMYKAGWFVDKDGNELTNRDAALNDILRHAFAIDKDTAISQTINPSNNIKGGEKNQRLLHRLMDEDEMESYIKGLQGELLDAYKE